MKSSCRGILIRKYLESIKSLPLFAKKAYLYYCVNIPIDCKYTWTEWYGCNAKNVYAMLEFSPPMLVIACARIDCLNNNLKPSCCSSSSLQYLPLHRANGMINIEHLHHVVVGIKIIIKYNKRKKEHSQQFTKVASISGSRAFVKFMKTL